MYNVLELFFFYSATFDISREGNNKFEIMILEKVPLSLKRLIKLMKGIQ